MTSAGTAYTHREIRLTLALIPRQKVIKQLSKPAHGFLDFGLVFQIPHDAAIGAGKPPQFLDKEWIRQMTHIKEQLHLTRRAKAMTKTQHLHAEWNSFAARTKPIKQQFSQRVNGVFRRIDDFVSQCPHGFHRFALGTNCVGQAFAPFRRMWPARFAEAARENFARCLKEKNRNDEVAFTEFFQLLREI